MFVKKTGLSKFNILKVSLGAKSSRFVIDLKQDLAGAEAKENKKNLITESKLEKLAELDYGQIFKTGSENAKKNFLAYAKVVGSRNFWAAVLVRLNSPRPDSGAKAPVGAETRPNASPTESFWRGLSSGRMATKDKDDKKKPWLTANSTSGKLWRQLDQLAFVALAKLILAVLSQAIMLIYKICYWAGWLIVFSLRLVYFVLLAMAGPMIRSVNFITGRFQPTIIKGLDVLLKGFRTAPAATLAALMKLAAWPKRIFQKFATAEEEDLTPLAPSPRWPALRRRLRRGESSGEAGLSKGGEYNPPRPLYQGGILKPVLAFAGVLLIIILPVKGYTYYKTIDSAKGKVLGASESAINNLISGGQAAANLDFGQADDSFTRAGHNFLIAQNQLAEINGLLFALASVVPLEDIQLAAASKNIVRAGGLSAAAGKNLSLAVESLFNYQASESDGILLNLTVYGHKAIANLTDLSQELEQINSQAVPEAYQKRFILLKQKVAELNRGLSEFIGLTDQIENFLGGNTVKRYLLIFQNNSELRASGGFIGSFALVDFLNGQIKNIEAPGGGSYDTEAGLTKKIKSPEPLRLVRSDWHFWDANWWPDWRASARKLAWFYENSDGPTVDGVIGLTPTVIEKILKVIGPIDLQDKYGVIIDAANFWPVTQKFAEQKSNLTREPKKIIGDLMNKIIEELPRRLNKSNLLPLLKAVEESLSDKNILFYFTDNELQAEVERLGWAGRIKETAGDYVSVIDTNIAGGKSDRKIKQEIIHQAQVQPDGTIIDNLTIKRTHEAIKREPFSGVRNVNWLRIYVPLGSKLIEARGFKPVDKIFFEKAEASWQNDPDLARGEALASTDEPSGTKIYNELGKTVFANWSQLDPGETIEINLKYQLPFKLTDKKPDQGPVDRLVAKASAVIAPGQKNLYSYSLLAQKQPGMNSSIITSELKLSDNFRPIWQFPADLTLSQNGWLITENFDQDKLMAVMVEEK